MKNRTTFATACIALLLALTAGCGLFTGQARSTSQSVTEANAETASVSPGEPAAVHTDVEVRVISQGAKFVGTSMGGVQITLRDAETGELLAEGLTAGSTGDTKKIKSAQPRLGDVMSTEDSAVFRTTLKLSEPRLIEATAYGPLAQRQSANRVSQTQFVVPGKDVTGGDAWLLELRGVVVDVLEPPTHVKLSGTPQTIRLHANVAMMCGCALTPGGAWDADQFEVGAILKRDGEKVRTVKLDYAGKPSQFATDVQVGEPGTYEATVYAYNASDGNTGLDTVTFIVQPAD